MLNIFSLANGRLFQEEIESLEELGAGFVLATHDMEIRGAGNILGREQSGSINKIGLNLYCQMLAEDRKSVV